MKFHLSSWKSEVLHFDGLFLSKSYKVSAKKGSLSWYWRVMQSLKKYWLVVSNMTWENLWIFTQPRKSSKILIRRVISEVWARKHRRIIFHDTEQWHKIWINPDLVAPKMTWVTGRTFIRALKVWKIVYSWDLFVKSI